MGRETKTNRFATAGKALVGSSGTSGTGSNEEKQETLPPKPKTKKKDKVVTAKVYPETWADFTAINKAQGMTNNSVINMLISEYVRSKRDIIL